MPLSEMEEARLQKFIDEMHFTDDQKPRIRTIAEMSKDQASLTEIKSKVIGDWYFITENRMKMRRWGIW